MGSRSPIGVGDRLRGDDGWWAGVTILVCQAAPGAIFRRRMDEMEGACSL